MNLSIVEIGSDSSEDSNVITISSTPSVRRKRRLPNASVGSMIQFSMDDSIRSISQTQEDSIQNSVLDISFNSNIDVIPTRVLAPLDQVSDKNPSKVDSIPKKRSRKASPKTSSPSKTKGKKKTVVSDEGKEAKLAAKISKGKFAMEEVEVCVHSQLLTSSVGSLIRDALTKGIEVGETSSKSVNSVTFQVTSRPGQPENSILWTRTKASASDLLKQAKEFNPRGPSSSLASVNGVLEPYLCLVLSGLEYLSLVCTKTESELASVLARYYDSFPNPRKNSFSSSQFHILVHSLPPALAQLRKVQASTFLFPLFTASTAGCPPSSMNSMSFIHFVDHFLYLNHQVNVLQLESTLQVSEFLHTITRSIAAAPYETSPNALACVQRVKVPAFSRAAIRSIQQREGLEASIDSMEPNDPKQKAGGKSDIETWWSMLQIIPGLSPEIATNIVARYPTIGSLMKRYDDPALSIKEKERLLESIRIDEGGGARKITKLSRSIYKALTTMDENEFIND
jgi:hypothetical protein